LQKKRSMTFGVEGRSPRLWVKEKGEGNIKETTWVDVLKNGVVEVTKACWKGNQSPIDCPEVLRKRGKKGGG